MKKNAVRLDHGFACLRKPTLAKAEKAIYRSPVFSFRALLPIVLSPKRKRLLSDPCPEKLTCKVWILFQTISFHPQVLFNPQHNL
ncbi:MAG TPA: hypothetical protein PKE31_12195 [Pseudomonadota bacterium]|nr:hypothetical protein [Pseudomonadota bacterium]HMU39761.1 hypothetical protein [Pseudomonadota bacterium]